MSSDPYTPLPSFSPGPDSTVLQPGVGAPPGPAEAAVSASVNPLPLGYTLQEYVIVGLIGEGGFGIVYLARDTQLGRMVALKEYMPATLASRGADNQVTVRSERQRDTFELGRRSFVNEAQLLAAFDQPSLVKVYRFWEQNGTAYMVMPFYEGPTIKQWLIENGSPPEAWLLGLLAPLMDALEVMHHNHCYHRDIAPDNILLLKQQATQAGGALPPMRPVLLDFGAARRVIVGDASQALTVILKPGYAPIEQYAESTAMKQGAWTDIYALCAVLYAAVVGKAPQPSVGRIVGDELVPAVKAGEGRYSPGFLEVIDKGLAVRPEHRPQTMDELRTMFRAVVPLQERQAPVRHAESPAAPASSPTAAAAPPAQPQAARPVPPPPPPLMNKAPSKADASVAAPPAPLPPPPPFAGGDPVAAPPPPQPFRPPESASRLGWMMAMAGGVLVAVAAGTWWALDAHRTPSKPLDVVVAVPPAVAVSVPVAEAASSAAAPASAPASAPTAVLATAKPFEVVAALQDMVVQADPLLSVNVLADKSRLAIGRDRIQFRVKSSESGYLYVFLSGTDKSQFYLLFPNGLDKDNRITANQEVRLPRKNWHITAGGPAGTDHIVVLVSKSPRDLADVGLRAAEDRIPEFDLGRAEQLWASRSEGVNPFVGKARCEDPALRCDGGYGATLLKIDEVGGKSAR